MLIKGDKIELNRLKYYIGKQIFVEWKFEAFMKDITELYTLKDEVHLVNVENNTEYFIDNVFIKCFYEAQESKSLNIITGGEKTYKYVVIINYRVNNRYFNGVPKLFTFKELNKDKDIDEFKSSFIKKLKKEIYDICESSIEFTNINLLKY